MRKKAVMRFIQIGLHKPQLEIIQKIEDEGREVTSLVRGLIDQYGKENYPKAPGYVEVAKEKFALKKKTVEEQLAWDKLDPAEYALNTLKARSAQGSAWFIIGVQQNNCNEYPVDLGEVKKYTLESPVVKDHFAVLNHNYSWFNGLENVEWSAEDCEICIAKYNKIMDEKEGKIPEEQPVPIVDWEDEIKAELEKIKK